MEIVVLHSWGILAELDILRMSKNPCKPHKDKSANYHLMTCGKKDFNVHDTILNVAGILITTITTQIVIS